MYGSFLDALSVSLGLRASALLCTVTPTSLTMIQLDKLNIASRSAVDVPPLHVRKGPFDPDLPIPYPSLRKSAGRSNTESTAAFGTRRWRSRIPHRSEAAKPAYWSAAGYRRLTRGITRLIAVVLKERIQSSQNHAYWLSVIARGKRIHVSP